MKGKAIILIAAVFILLPGSIAFSEVSITGKKTVTYEETSLSGRGLTSLSGGGDFSQSLSFRLCGDIRENFFARMEYDDRAATKMESLLLGLKQRESRLILGDFTVLEDEGASSESDSLARGRIRGILLNGGSSRLGEEMLPGLSSPEKRDSEKRCENEEGFPVPEKDSCSCAGGDIHGSDRCESGKESSKAGIELDGYTLLFSLQEGKIRRESFISSGRFVPYKLAAAAMVDNSESIWVDGRKLVRNVDYSIDFTNGIITFLEEVPIGARVTVVYQEKDEGGDMNRYLVGTRGFMDLNERTKLRLGVMKTAAARNEDEADCSRTQYNLEQKTELSERLSIRVNVSHSEKEYSIHRPEDSQEGSRLMFETAYKLRPARVRVYTVHVDPEFEYILPVEEKPANSNGFGLDLSNGRATVSLDAKKVSETINLSGRSSERTEFLANLCVPFMKESDVSLELLRKDSHLEDHVNQRATLLMRHRTDKFLLENSLTDSRGVAETPFGLEAGAKDYLSRMIRINTYPINKFSYFAEYSDRSARDSILEEKHGGFRVKADVNEKISITSGLERVDSTLENGDPTPCMDSKNFSLDWTLSPGLTASPRFSEKTEATKNFETAALQASSLGLGLKYRPGRNIKLSLDSEFLRNDYLLIEKESRGTRNSFKFETVPIEGFELELGGNTRSREYHPLDGGIIPAEHGVMTRATFTMSKRTRFSARAMEGYQNEFKKASSERNFDLRYKIRENLDLISSFSTRRRIEGDGRIAMVPGIEGRTDLRPFQSGETRVTRSFIRLEAVF